MINLKSCAFTAVSFLGIFATSVLQSAKQISSWLVSLVSLLFTELWKKYNDWNETNKHKVEIKSHQTNRNQYGNRGRRSRLWRPRNTQKTNNVVESGPDFHWIWLTCKDLFQTLVVAVSVALEWLKNMFMQQQ